MGVPERAGKEGLTEADPLSLFPAIPTAPAFLPLPPSHHTITQTTHTAHAVQVHDSGPNLSHPSLPGIPSSSMPPASRTHSAQPTSSSSSSGQPSHLPTASPAPEVIETHHATARRHDTSGKKMVNQYIVYEQIGKGMHGIVRRGVDDTTGQTVVRASQLLRTPNTESFPVV